MKKLICSMAVICFLLIFFSACSTENNTDTNSTESVEPSELHEQIPQTVEGKIPVFELETKSEISFDSDKDGWIEKWDLFTAKVDKGFVAVIEAYTPTNALSGEFNDYYNAFFCETDSVRFEKSGENLMVIFSKDDESSKYEVSFNENNIILKNIATGELMPYFGDQKRPEGINQ